MKQTKLSLRGKTQMLATQVASDECEQGDHVRFVASVLRACATVLEAEVARKRGPGLSKSGEYPSIIDLEQSPNGGSWRVA